MTDDTFVGNEHGHRFWSSVAVALVASSVTASCSTTSHTPRTALPSLTPPITAKATSSLRGGLITQADLDVTPSVTGITVASLGSGQVFTDPDPRGPCGAKLNQPSLEGAAGEALQGAVNGVELIIHVDPAVAEDYVSAVQRDTRPGCPNWQSMTNTGATQTGELVTAVPLSVPADQATAALLRVTSQGSKLAGTEIILRDGGTVSVTIMFSAATLAVAPVQLLALKEATQLRAVAS
jgi:hypothetical protein